MKREGVHICIMMVTMVDFKPSHANKRKKERQRITRSTSCTDD